MIYNIVVNDKRNIYKGVFEMLKLYNLYRQVKVEKETEKAVYVLPRKIDLSDLEEINSLCSIVGVDCYTLNNDGFWLPKSQIKIKGGKVIKMSKWLCNKLFEYYDSSFFLVEDVERLKQY